MAFLGVGHWHEAMHAEAVRTAGAEIEAAWDPAPDAMRIFTGEFGGKGYLNYRDLLADPEVDAVVVALPHHLHTDVAIACAEAGKHIMRLSWPAAPISSARGPTPPAENGTRMKGS